jgi:protein-S-isoprenylcysteine O-methyltransferase
MTLPHLLTIALTLIWLAFEATVSAKKRPDARTARSADRSLTLLWLANASAISIAMTLDGSGWLDRHVGGPRVDSLPLAYGGCALIVAGLTLRGSAIRALGKRFTVQVAIVDQHQILRTGLYRWVRHPSYLGSLISLLGLSLALRSWLCLALLLLLPLAATLYRIQVEEAVLRGHFGEAYEAYARRSWRLVPGLY